MLLRSQTDERLVALARLGNRRAFELIVERYRRPLAAYARRVDPQRGEDLVQQTFLAALSALQAGAEVRHLRGWLYEILRNQSKRDHAPVTPLTELDESHTVIESAQQQAERRMLAIDALGAVAALPTRQHDAIVQMAFHGLSRTEVADSMGLSEGAVRQLVHRARATLRTAVTAITPMPVLRWLYSPRSGSVSGLTEVTLGAGTASGAGLALKVGVGAIVASGVVATGVISVVSPHHRPARVASASPSASVQKAGASGSGSVAQRAGEIGSGLSGPRAPLASSGRGTSPGLSRSTARVGADGLLTTGTHGSGRGPSSGSGGRDGGGSDGSSGTSGSGPGSGARGSDGGSGSGSGSTGDGSGSGSGSGSDGGSSGSGSGGGSGSGDGGSSQGGSDGSSGSGSSGSDGGGSQPGAVTSGHDGGGSGSDGGGLSGSSGSGSGLTTSGGDASGSGGGSNSGDLGSGSGSGSGDGGGATGSDGGSGSGHGGSDPLH
jgi:RNA polymerase sigma factor (sigma-70 family)